MEPIMRMLAEYDIWGILILLFVILEAVVGYLMLLIMWKQYKGNRR